ncbi:hypothetical protein [Nonomuraea rhizosphaerae]|uniref:hypothetical protein n=1 Tax=Nonomuraea rhizosphaerae TaxID=2665663 RepID=UPI001C5FDB0C|nr:hypothetical protein [Nonomuraea rhizosphaerae]
MRYMTNHGQSPAGPPGLPLWLAAERARVAAGAGKQQWAKTLGIGRVTYDRLTTQASPPIARTVKKIADVIGIDIDEAMRLAGLAGETPNMDVVVIRDGRHIVIQAKHIKRQIVEQQLDLLRRIADEAGRTLGDILVVTELAGVEELELHQEEQQVVNTSEDPFFTVEFLANHQKPT